MTLTVIEPRVPLAPLRTRLRELGLTERQAGTSYFYAAGDGGRMLLVLQPFGYGAQVYLYPEALGRVEGAAQWFYALLEAEGFGMGSKAGPSISLPLADAARMATFWTAFERLVRGPEEAP